MPDWLQAIITLTVTVVIVWAMVRTFARVTAPPRWDDPKLSERERDKAWIDWQW